MKLFHTLGMSLFLFFSLPTITYAATIYYVAPSGSDNNNGTQASPWKTIQKAADTMDAGDTVIIKNGIYNQHVDLTGSTGVEGKSGNVTDGYISYTGESRDGVIIDGTGLGWGSGFMSGYSGRGGRPMNFIKISNMTIQNFVGDGVIFYGDKSDGNYPRIASHDIILDNLKVHDNDMGGIMFCGGENPNSAYNIVVKNCEVYNNHGDHHGIKLSGDPRVIWTGEHIHDSIIEHNLVYNNDELGIHTSSGNYNITVRNNIVHDNGYSGIAAEQVHDNTYLNNTVYSNGKSNNINASVDGMVFWNSRNITLIGNKIYDNLNGAGINIPSAMQDGNPTNPIVTNNVIYNNFRGIQFSSPVNGGAIYNNTVAFNSNVGLFFYSTTTHNTVKNNIFYHNANQVWDSSGNTYDNNLYYPDVAFAARGSHDSSGDPQFINPSSGDYHLQPNSPACTGGENGTYIGAYACGAGNTPTPLAGDLNGDSHVDLYDYNILVTYFGNPYTIYDYNILVANFGK